MENGEKLSIGNQRRVAKMMHLILLEDDRVHIMPEVKNKETNYNYRNVHKYFGATPQKSARQKLEAIAD